MRISQFAMRCSALALVCIFITASSARAAVVLSIGDQLSFQTALAQANGSDFPIHFTTSTLPYTDSVKAVTDNTTSTVNTSLTQSLFSYDFIHTTTDTDLEAKGTGEIEFTVTVDTPYVLSGFYKMTSNADPRNDGPFSQLAVQLVDFTDVNNIIFLFDQVSNSLDSNSSFVLEGDPQTNPLTGTFLAGHVYQLAASAEMSFSDPIANGIGNVSLAFTNPTTPGGPGGPSTPLPAGVWAGAVGVACVRWAGKRMRAPTAN